MDKRKITWSILFLLIVLLSIWAIVSQNKQFSFSELCISIKEANPFMIAGAVICMLGFIIFECLALRCIASGLGYKKSGKQLLLYSASDIYFSAITPSASGGQPASAYFMMRDEIPTAVTTVILLINVMLYTLGIALLGTVCMVFRFDIFMKFSNVSKIFIVIGYSLLWILCIIFYLLLKKENIIYRVGNKFIDMFEKYHVLKHADKKRSKLKMLIDEYRICAKLIVGKKKMLWSAFIFNLLQKNSQILVSVFIYLAIGGKIKNIFEIWVIQTYSVVGSNCVPIPGSIGVTDYLMIDGFSMSGIVDNAVNLELMSRSIAFYFCVLVCGIIVLCGYLKGRKKNVRSL